MNVCPHCGSKQVRGADRSWFECSDCTRLLFDEVQQWIYEAEPGHGEKDLIDIIQYCATNPDKVFSKDAPEHFFGLVKERHTDGRFSDAVGDYFHHRESSSRTLLTSLLRVAAYFDTPLISILTKSAFSASCIQLENVPAWPIGPHPSRCARPIETREKLRQEIEASLSQGLEGKCLAKICHELNITSSTANRWHPNLVPQLAKHHKKLRIERRARQTARLKSLSYLDLVSELESAGWHRLPYAIARRLGVPVYLVRERISELRNNHCTKPET